MKTNFTLLMLVALMGISSISSAQISVRSQLSHDEVMSPGSTYRGSILIRNDTAEIQQAKLYQTDYSFKSDGSNQFGPAGVDVRSNANWIELGTTTMMVPPNESVSISYQVNVPADAELSGTFWSVIMVEGVPKSSAESIGNNSPDNSLGVLQVTRYGVQVATHIEGTGAATLEITETALLNTEDGNTVLRFHVANNGDKMVRPEIWVELYDESGNAIGKKDGVNNRLYPGTSVQQQVKLGKLAVGKYEALVIMDAGQDEVFAGKFTLNIE